jgi:hypothetical protein
MQQHPGSFRDPSGFVFQDTDSLVIRSITASYFPHYDHLMASGLYDSLIKKNFLIPHQEDKTRWNQQERIIIPTLIPFISYPYEWSFSQLKDAALLTLTIQKEALSHGMTLKDASVYNVQFYKGAPIFIDTLSFELYEEGTPWIAYKQFCEHFLAPLALMAYKDIRLSALLKQYLDGIPVSLAAKLLPFRSYFNLSFLLHIHFHANAQKKYESQTSKRNNYKVSKTQMWGLLDSLKSGIESCSYMPEGTEWAEYYKDDSYTQKGFESKQVIVTDFLRLAAPKIVFDIGANNGFFSRLAALHSDFVVSMDYDVACVEKNYCLLKEEQDNKILPLVMDISNPTGGSGWASKERQALSDRCRPDCVLALAVIHHLAFSNNVPLNLLASYFSELTKSWLIIEFVPKADKKVQVLLATRKDIFGHYTIEDFESSFEHYFNIVSKEQINDSQRILYLMKLKHKN